MKPASICRCGSVRAHLLSYVYFDIVLLSAQFSETLRIHSSQDLTACQFRNTWLFCTFVCAIAQAQRIQNCTFADIHLIGSVFHRPCREAFSTRMHVTRVARKNCTFVVANGIQLQLSLVSRPGSHKNHRQLPQSTPEYTKEHFFVFSSPFMRVIDYFSLFSFLRNRIIKGDSCLNRLS